ncbi:MAG: ATP-binding protein [Roseimicrobium sp.]
MSEITPTQEHSFVSAEQLLAAIVDSSDDAIISKSLQGIVTSWNKGAQRIFGYVAGEMIGQPILKLIPPERQQEEPAILERLRRGERVDHFDTQRITKEGRLVDVSLTISPVRNQEGVIVGASKIARDITEQKRGARVLIELSEEAQRQSRIKDEFIATLSHELRTPLQSILGWVQLLRSGQSEPDELEQGLEVIDRNVRAQQRIIEDLLDINRILSGKIRLDVQALDLVPLITAALEAVAPAAQAKGIRIQTVLDPLAAVTSGDPQRLQQIFWNLLSNAIKFTPAGGKVHVLLERVNSHVEITVSDTGVGIAPEFLPHVFDRFRQQDGSSTKRYGGLGLGLAIAKNLTELHGGRINAKSAGVDKGATFVVGLPLLPVKQKHDPRDYQSSAEVSPLWPNLDGVKVLVVDDEEDTRNLVATTMARAGATVRNASSAAEAMKRFGEEVPHVLVSDVGMPDTDGYALIRLVRALPAEKGGTVPAIALTAYARMEDRITAISSGFQVLVAKPADALELLKMVEAFGKKR